MTRAGLSRVNFHMIAGKSGRKYMIFVNLLYHKSYLRYSKTMPLIRIRAPLSISLVWITLNLTALIIEHC